MVCPKGFKFTTCQDVNGYFLGVRDGNTVKCRVSEYVKYESDVLFADELSYPYAIDCSNGNVCVGKEVGTCQKNGVS